MFRERVRYKEVTSDPRSFLGFNFGGLDFSFARVTSFKYLIDALVKLAKYINSSDVISIVL
jgi:hypothetical protein